MAKKSQHPNEIAGLLELIRGATSILEIGSRYGEALRMFADVANPNAKLISVELPDSLWGRSDSLPILENLIAQLQDEGFDAKLFIGSSRDQSIINLVREEGPFDFVFIDGDHTFEGIREDFMNYASLGNIVAFHDIAAHGASLPTGENLGVPQIWNVVKELYIHTEIIDTPEGLNPMGIGILWRSI